MFDLCGVDKLCKYFAPLDLYLKIGKSTDEGKTEFCWKNYFSVIIKKLLWMVQIKSSVINAIN